MRFLTGGNRPPAHSALKLKPTSNDSTQIGAKALSELTLQIYALNRGNIHQVIQAMEKLWEQETISVVLESEEDQKNIALLSDDQVCYIIKRSSWQQFSYIIFSISAHVKCITHLNTALAPKSTLGSVKNILQKVLRNAFCSSAWPCQQSSWN